VALKYGFREHVKNTYSAAWWSFMMPALSNDNRQRSVGRRAEDLLLRDKLRKHDQLFNVGQIITSEMNLSALFEVIMEETNHIIDSQRSTVFLHDKEGRTLWSLVATGMDNSEIRISEDHGVAGCVFRSKTPLVINDAYKDDRFYSEVDKESGFRTRNILCIPLINRAGDCIGVLQALNKRSGPFTEEDKELLTAISHYMAIALENSKLYEDVKDYSEQLKETLIRIETLERVKAQLTKFVPSSVAKLAEKNPDRLNSEKVPMDVTILFIDIQGFSKITEHHEQRLVNDMVESHFSQYLDCVNRHGGEINETSGDGLMVIFKEGDTKSHAKRAVAAGLEIIAENNLLNKNDAYPWGRVDLHMGINSGEAWVGSTKMKSLTGERWTYTASGLVTVLAARIGALSEKSRLYVGPETHQRVEDEYDCEYIGTQSVKNVHEPVPVYRIKASLQKHGRRHATQGLFSNHGGER
jgi:class 3 adenylate cyclase